MTLFGVLVGTTYSGHPTCTSCCGTLRNLTYNYYGLTLVQDNLSFAAKIHALPTFNYRHKNG